jgi:hypothetical protein
MECANRSWPACRRHQRQSPAGQARRAADHAQVAIVGDSRILFDTDQARFEALTGVRPVQVSFVGTNSRTAEHFANDPVSTGCCSWAWPTRCTSACRYRDRRPRSKYLKNDKPAQLTGLWIDRWLQNTSHSWIAITGLAC